MDCSNASYLSLENFIAVIPNRTFTVHKAIGYCISCNDTFRFALDFSANDSNRNADI